MSQKNCEQDKSINCLPGSHKFDWLILKPFRKWTYRISCCPESFYSVEKDVGKCFPNSYLEAWVSLSGVCRFCDSRFRGGMLPRSQHIQTNPSNYLLFLSHNFNTFWIRLKSLVYRFCHPYFGFVFVFLCFCVFVCVCVCVCLCIEWRCARMSLWTSCLLVLPPLLERTAIVKPVQSHPFQHLLEDLFNFFSSTKLESSLQIKSSKCTKCVLTQFTHPMKCKPRSHWDQFCFFSQKYIWFLIILWFLRCLVLRNDRQKHSRDERVKLGQ